ncbi:MAG: aldehyde dehydrogenase family protein [Verrucomicrobiae bacterium]|nr:aldehyde dehydrogenase family protein [Verrucomicrobiae bacterium]
MAIRLHTSFINGKRLPRSGPIVKRFNPGRTRQEASRCSHATADAAEAAMDAASASFPCWSDQPVKERVQILEHVLQRIEKKASGFARMITGENGKTLKESRLEVAAGLADARFHLADALRSRKETVSSPNTAARTRLFLEPVGVYVLITPWNFPLATILRKLIPALAFGNTAVVKPSGYTPGIASLLFDVVAAAKIPVGVANLVLGGGSEVGPALTAHEALRGVSFTGSTANGLHIARSVAGRDVRLQLEMGGKNSLLVLQDADLEAAVDAAVVGAFSCAGQWCTGTGRAIVEETIYDAFCSRLVGRTNALVVGPGDNPKTQMGPLISRESLRETREAIRIARSEGARVRCGGKAPSLRKGQGGNFLLPTVLSDVDETMAAFHEELFAPVLPVVRARNFEDGLRLANQGNFGLSASIFTNNKKYAEVFLRKVEAGIAHVNLHTAFRTPNLPVAGWRDSGRGIPECGRFARDFYTRPRAAYVAT